MPINFVMIGYIGPLARGRTTPNARRRMAKFAYWYGAGIRRAAHYMNTSWRELHE